jgi:hypothetical protein
MEPEEIESYLNQTENIASTPYSARTKRYNPRKEMENNLYNFAMSRIRSNQSMMTPTLNVGLQFPSDSSYDEGITGSDLQLGINKYRDEQQSDALAFGNAVLHGAVSAGTALGTTALMVNPYGLAALGAATVLQGVVNGTDENEENDNPLNWFLNNAIFQTADFIQSSVKENTPVYTSDMDKQGLSKYGGLAGFDAFLEGVGFLAGGVGGARMAATKLGQGSKFYNNLLKLKGGDKLLKGKTIEEASRLGLEAGQDLDKLNKAVKFADSISGLTASAVGRIGESAMEAYGTKQEMIDAGYTEPEADDAMSETFVTNMALSLPEYFQNLKMLGTFKGILNSTQDLSRYSDDVMDIANAGKTQMGKADKAKDILSALGQGIVFEGGEEGIQYAINKAAQQSVEDEDNFLKSFIGNFQESFTTEEGQLSWILGSLLGGGMSSIGAVKGVKDKNKQISEYIADAETVKNDREANYTVDENKFYKTIKTPDGSTEKVINQDYLNNIRKNSELEAIKIYAESKNDKQLYEVAKNKQVLNKALFNIRTNTFDEFINELESSKDLSLQELKALKAAQTNKPISEIELTDQDIKDNAQSIQEAVDLAKDFKSTYDSLGSIPSLASLSKPALFKFADIIGTQKSIAKELQKVRPEILPALEEYSNEFAFKGTEAPKTKKGQPDKRTNAYKNAGLATALEGILDPIKAEELKINYENYKELNVANKELLSQYEKYLKNPELLEVETRKEELQKKADIVEKKINETVKENEINAETETKLNQLKNSFIDNAITISTPNGDMLVNVVNSKFIDPTTGEEIDEELVKESIKTEITETKKSQESGEEFTEKEEYQETEDVLDGAKKPDLFSTSTRGFEVDLAGNKVVVFYGNPANEAAYQRDSKFYNIVKWFSNWKNTPGLNNKKYTARVFIEQPTEKTLTDTNNWRRSKKLEPLTMEDLMSNPGYMLIGINILENGKSVSEDIMHYHDVDYFANTQEFENLAKESANEKELAARLQESREKFIKERTKLIDAIKANQQVEIEVVSKSNGIVNYNPKIGGKNQVLPIFHLGSLGGEIFQKDKDGKPIVYSNGIGVIIAEDKESYTIRYEGNKEGKQGYESVIPKTQFNGYVGQTVFGTVTANGTPYLTKTTQREFSDENLESLATLINHRLTTQENIFKVGNQEFTIIGKSENRGIVDSLLNWGFKKDAKEKQIQFKADGVLVLGKQEVLPTDPDAKQKIKKFLSVYKSYLSFTAGTLDSKLAFPTEIVDGKADTDIQTVAKFLFGGDAPLIGTNINSEVPFINSYFEFKVGPNGLNIVTKEEAEESPYMDDLDATFGEAPKPSDFEGAETIGELTDEGEIKPVTPTAPVITGAKAEIERKRQEELDTIEDLQNMLNKDLNVTSKIRIDSYLNGLHYIQTEDGKYYVVPDSNSSGYGGVTAKQVTKEQIIKPFRTEAEWKKVGVDITVLEETKLVEVKPITTELDKEVKENDKVCQGNNPKDAGKPATLSNKKFKDSDDSDWD